MPDPIQIFQKRFSALLMGVIAIVAIQFFIRQTGKLAPEINHTFTGQTMGTTYSIKIGNYPLGLKDKTRLHQQIQEQFKAFNQIFSTYIPNSEISQLNQNNTNKKIKVSNDLFELLELSTSLYHQTGGYFDMTITPLLQLWKKAHKDQKIPSVPQIKNAQQKMGSNQFELNDTSLSITKNQEIEFNVNAVAKGYGVDFIATFLKEKGCENIMVEIGGEVSCIGRNFKGEPWTIGIDFPADLSLPGQEIITTVSLTNEAMATSGDYRQFQIIENKKYSHTINPKSGYPASSNLASVSVIAQNCTTADAIATALHVMGTEVGKDWLKQRQDIKALFILRDKNNNITQQSHNGFFDSP